MNKTKSDSFCCKDCNYYSPIVGTNRLGECIHPLNDNGFFSTTVSCDANCPYGEGRGGDDRKAKM